MLVITVSVLLLLLVSISVLVWAAIGNSRERGSRDAQAGLSIFFGVVGLVATIIAILVWSTTYYDSVSEIAELEAFYNNTLSAYEYAVTATDEIEISGAEPGIIDIAHQQQAVAAAERIKELRNEVANYNTRLAKLLRWNTMIITSDLYANPPAYLKPIRIGEVDGEARP